MNNKKNWIFIISAIAIPGILIFFLLYEGPIAPDGQAVTVNQLISDLKKINKIEVKARSLKLSNNGVYVNNTVRDEAGNIEPGSKFINIFAYKHVDVSPEGTEVRVVMRTWLYVHRHIVDDIIVGVNISYSRARFAMNTPESIFVSKQEFEQILSEIDNRDTLSDEALVDALSKEWIIKNNYTPVP